MSVSLLSDFAAAMERIRAVTGCGTQRELGRFLGINQSAISDAKRRGLSPAEWLLTLLRGKGINPDWILTGKGARRLAPAEAESRFSDCERNGHQSAGIIFGLGIDCRTRAPGAGGTESDEP